MPSEHTDISSVTYQYLSVSFCGILYPNTAIRLSISEFALLQTSQQDLVSYSKEMKPTDGGTKKNKPPLTLITDIYFTTNINITLHGQKTGM